MITPFASTFGCLATCDQIQVLHISTTILQIIGQDIGALVRGGLLKNLRELHFVYDRALGRKQISLYVLRTFAQHCKMLTILQIPLDTCCLGGNLEAMRSEIADSERGSNILHELVIPRLPTRWDYSMSTAIAFSSLLDHLFPRLRIFKGEPAQSDEQARWWEGVDEMLFTFRRIRGTTIDVDGR